MKTKNFPERKNQRRVAALSRMENQDSDVAKNTRARIVNNARDIRTKKIRG